MPQALIFAFIVMAIPNLRLSFPPLHDPYYYFVTTLNVVNHGSLDPILKWWYPQIDMQLYWPNMQLITTNIYQVTKMDLMQIMRFQEPLLGTLIFLGTFILARRITGKNNVAFLSALLASFSSTLIFYLSEYQPQGLVFIYFVFLLYFYIAYKSSKNIAFGILTIMFAITIALTHHFSSLFIAILAIAYLMVINIVSVLPYFKKKFRDIFQDIKADNTLFLLIAIIMLPIHLFAYTTFGRDALFMLLKTSPTSQFIITGTTVPAFFTFLNSTKWILLILALISVIYILKTKNINEFRCAIILGCILITGFIGTFIVFSPTDRITGFFMPLAALFASLTIFRLRDYTFKILKRKLPVFILILIVSIPMIGGLSSSQTPAYFFHNSEVNTYYWYSNKLPSMDEYKESGEWTGNYISQNSTIGVEFDTVVIPFFYGKHPINNINRIANISKNSNDYIMVNPDIPYSYGGYQKKNFDLYFNVIYDNNELKIYYQ